MKRPKRRGRERKRKRGMKRGGKEGTGVYRKTKGALEGKKTRK